MVAVSIFAIIVLLLKSNNSELENFVIPEHVQMLSMYDSASQGLAHKVSVFSLAVLVLIFIYGTPAGRNGTLRFGTLDRALGTIRGSAGIIVFVGALIPIFWMTFGIQLSILIAAVLILLLVIKHRIRPFDRLRQSPSVWFWFLLTGYLVVILVPGLILPPALPPSTFFAADWHYSMTIAQGSRLAAGLPLGDLVNPNYGVLHLFAQAVMERRLGTLDFGSAVRLVQWSQVSFVIAVVAAFFFWRRRQPTLMLFGLLFLGPWIGTFSRAIVFPNQSGWRFLGLAIGILLIAILRQQTRRRQSYILGAATTLLVLYNPETGIAVTCGFLSFLVLVDGFSLGFVKVLARFIFAAAAVLTLVVVLYFLEFGLWSADVFSFVNLISAFSRGYGGLKVYFDPLAFGIFVHSAVIVAGGVIIGWSRGLSPGNAARIAIAVIILVWGAYYWNRPHVTNLWTFSFLYLFLISDKISPRYISSLLSKHWSVVFDVRFALIFFLLLPRAIVANYSEFRDQISAHDAIPGDVTKISGVLLETPLAKLIYSRADYIISNFIEEDEILVSNAQYMMSLLTGKFNKLPVQDVFVETKTLDEFENLVTNIHRIGPSRIVFGDPNSIDGSISPFRVWRHSFENKLKERLSNRYKKIRYIGWLGNMGEATR